MCVSWLAPAVPRVAPGGGFVDVVRGVHADLSRGLGAVRDRLRGAGFGKEHAIVPAPPPLPATRRRS